MFEMFEKFKAQQQERAAQQQEKFLEEVLVSLMNVCDVYEQFRLQKLQHVDGILANPFISPEERIQAMVGREIFMAEGLAHMEIREAIETKFRKDMETVLANVRKTNE